MSSSREQIGLGLEAFLTTVIDPVTSAPLFPLVKLGAVFDPSQYMSWLEITFPSAKSGPAGAGGNLVGWRIEDNPIYQLTSGWDYEADSRAAMLAMLHAMDVLNPILHSHFQLPSPTNPLLPIAAVYSLLEDQVERTAPSRFPNGRVYLLWHTFCTTKSQYNVTLQIP